MSTPPETSSSNQKPAKAPKQPKAEASGSAAPAGESSKGKSAKDIKKEKRAAAVAARGGGHDPREEAAQAAKAAAEAQQAASAAGKGKGSGAASATAGAGPSSGPAGKSQIPSRPPFMATESAAPFIVKQQNLFFSHLPTSQPQATPSALKTGKLHPLVLRLGVLMSSGTLRGANARTMAMMIAFKEVIRDYESPEQAVLWKDLMGHMSPMIGWLESCRPKGVGGGNAIRWLKGEINKLGEEGSVLSELSERDQKQHLIREIDQYMQEKIDYPATVISNLATEKIKPGDVVVTYARSSTVERVLVTAWDAMQRVDPLSTFEVVVVDSRPLHEGRNLLDALNQHGVPCTLALLPSLPVHLRRASLTLLGASALHSDGALQSRAGTAVVAMLSKEYRVPVVACVETYKFGEKVVLDGLGSNELGGVEGLVQLPGKKALMEGKDLTPLALMYDLTPPEYITAVCTELGFIPPSSVPTVLGKASGVV